MLALTHQLFAVSVVGAPFIYSNVTDTNYVSEFIVGFNPGISDTILLTSFLFIYVLGSILPDIDHKKSLFSKAVPFLSFIVRIFVKHRGLTHRLDLLAIGIAMVLYLPRIGGSYLILALLTGMFAHVLGDMHTKAGVKIFGGRNWGILPKVIRFRTGGKMEMKFFKPLYWILSIIGITNMVIYAI
jgi:membrane-bound metal-dependent hydrolase YbcI (DUF457 family)